MFTVCGPGYDLPKKEEKKPEAENVCIPRWMYDDEFRRRTSPKRRCCCIGTQNFDCPIHG
jgi:hypothetical protein